MCDHEGVEPLAHLGSVPVHVGLLWYSADAARSCPRGELDLVLCPRCGHVANAAFDPGLLDYTGDYDNALHHSPSFREWEAGLVRHLAARLGPGGTVVEIGCGDARFLAALCADSGARGVGFEPGHNPERTSELVASAEVSVIADFATPEAVAAHRPDLVVTRHVLEHVPTPGAFLGGLARGLSDGVALYVEVPDLGFALERGAVEDFMYEHCGYYTPLTLARSLRSAGFVVEDARSTFSGMFAAVTGHLDGAPRRPTADDDPDLASEVARIRTAMAAVTARIDRIADELDRRRRRGQKLVAWGGGARTVGLMNLVPGAVDAIDLVVDVNPRKQGTHVTGTGQLIADPRVLVDDPPDAVLVVNPVYRDEIVGMLTDLGVGADVFIV